VMAEQIVELWPEESKQVLFEAVPYLAKVHYVSVNGLTGSFTARLGIVVMQRGMGHHWHRRPPEINWELLLVTFQARSFMVEPVTLDRAVVEVAGQREEVGIDLELKYHFDEVIYTMPIETIKDAPSAAIAISLQPVSHRRLQITMKQRVATAKPPKPRVTYLLVTSLNLSLLFIFA
ncbi:unnamed protein product, partial [marine sediment metagenome]